MFARNPKTRFIAAHFAWYGNDVARASRSCSTVCRTSTWKSRAVLYEFGRQPAPGPSSSPSTRTACCSGRTRTEPSEYPYYWRVFETRDEYFDYYRNYHAFWKLYGMGLPDQVLRKLYTRTP